MAVPKEFVSSKVNFGQSLYVGYPYGTTLKNDSMYYLMEDIFRGDQLPMDETAQYFILPSQDVASYDLNVQFCEVFCGFHRIDAFWGSNIKYAMVGDPMTCPDNCSVKSSYQNFGFQTSPNNDWSADSMASIMLHELSEMTTDPSPFIGVAWQDVYGSETMDLCAWYYGNLYLTNNGSVGNVKIGSRDF